MKASYFLKNLVNILVILGSLSLFSCGSSKHYYNPYEVNDLSKRLSIPLNNKNAEDDKNTPLYVECSSWLGRKYKYGGNTKKGTDCSGMTKEIYYKVYKKNIPRTTADQFKQSKKTKKSKAEPGDLVFFATTKKKKSPTHVGIYLKEDKFIHASTSKGVIVSSLNESYYTRNFLGIRKIR